MTPYELICKILSRSTCAYTDCRECKELYGGDCMLKHEAEGDDIVNISKRIVERLNSQYADVNSITEEDIVNIIYDIVVE